MGKMTKNIINEGQGPYWVASNLSFYPSDIQPGKVENIVALKIAAKSNDRMDILFWYIDFLILYSPTKVPLGQTIFYRTHAFWSFSLSLG